MRTISPAVLLIGLVTGFAGEAVSADLVPGGWDSEVAVQSFSEAKPPAHPAIGRVGTYGYGVIPGTRSYSGIDSSLPYPAGNLISRDATYNALVPLAKSVRRNGTTRRRSPR